MGLKGFLGARESCSTNDATGLPALRWLMAKEDGNGMQAKAIGVVANAGSGRNSREKEAVEHAMEVFGPNARLVYWEPETDRMADLIDELEGEGRDLIVAAGGDGTIMAVASEMRDRKAAMGVLPLGTFNFFARGLGLPQEPQEAAEAILAGRAEKMSLGTVNGQVFLNNASLGIYPSILKQREDVYERWGRYRLLAHWSVIKTFLGFQRPMRLSILADGERREFRTPLLFVARSAYQIEHYGLEGTEAINGDRFAMFVAKAEGRAGLFRLAWRLVSRRLEVGRDVTLIDAAEIEVELRQKTPLVAFDGEKARMRAPLRFEILKDAISVVMPSPEDEVSA